MKLNTAIAIAVAAAFAVPLAAQASAEADRIILAQTSGKITTDPKDSNPAAPPATTGAPRSEAGATSRGGFSALDKNGDGHISRDEAKDATWSNRFTELDKDNDGRLSQSEFNAMQAGAGATVAPGATSSGGAPLTSGTNAPDRKPSTPKQ
jgi:hypothetical protein